MLHELKLFHKFDHKEKNKSNDIGTQEMLQ